MPDQYCLPITLSLVAETPAADPLWVGLGFLIGFLLGAAIMAACARPCLRSISKKLEQDDDDMLQISMGMTKKEYRQMNDGTSPGQKQQLGHITMVELEEESKKRLSTKKRSKVKGAYVYEDENDDEDSDGDVGEFRCGMADVLLQNNSDWERAEMLRQDVDNVKRLEDQQNYQRKLVFLKLLAIELSKHKKKGQLDEHFCDNFVKKTDADFHEMERMCQADKQEAINELNQNNKLKSDPQALDTELENLHQKYSQKHYQQIKDARVDVRQSLIKTSGLSDADIEAIMERMRKNMAKMEEHLADEQTRQALALEDRLARRRQLADQRHMQDDVDNAELESRYDAVKSTTDGMVHDGKILEKQRDELLQQHAENVRRLQEQLDNNAAALKLNLAERLKQQRERKFCTLAKKHKKEQAQYMATTEKGVNTETFVQTIQELLHQQNEEKNALNQKLDSTETQEFLKVKMDQATQKETVFIKEEERLHEHLQSIAMLTDRATDKLMNDYRKQTGLLLNQRIKEKQRMQKKIYEKLAIRRKKQEEEEQLRLAEQDSLQDQQDSTVRDTLSTNLDIDEAAKDRILQEHQQNLQALNSQLEMSRLKQRKNVEKQLSMRQARLTDLKLGAKQAKANANEKEQEKLQKQLDAQVASEETRIEELRETSMAELQKRLNDETNTLLQQQDHELGLLIGRLQVGHARRQAILDKQDETVKDLQAQLEKRVTNNDIHLPANETEQIIQEHYNQVANLSQQVAMNKERQEQLLKQKLEKKRASRQRELEDELQESTQDEFIQRKSRGTNLSAASAILSRALIDQRHHRRMEELERDMKVELEKQKEQLNRELQDERNNELQTQKQQFLTQLAAISNLSQKDINDAVDTAINKRNSTKKTRKLAKDLRSEIQRAKTDLGVDGDDGNEQYAYTTALRRVKTDLQREDTGSTFEEDKMPPKLSKRRKPKRSSIPKDAFAYSSMGDGEDDF